MSVSRCDGSGTSIVMLGHTRQRRTCMSRNSTTRDPGRRRAPSHARRLSRGHSVGSASLALCPWNAGGGREPEKSASRTAEGRPRAHERRPSRHRKRTPGAHKRHGGRWLRGVVVVHVRPPHPRFTSWQWGNLRLLLSCQNFRTGIVSDLSNRYRPYRVGYGSRITAHARRTPCVTRRTAWLKVRRREATWRNSWARGASQIVPADKSAAT